jgi:exopolyphosphatase / guanosine-5'-triphosphate,3'-diphosphate pyrophosphatase
VSWRTTRISGQEGQANEQVAVVDLGSNSWRLVVFTYGAGPWWKLTDELYETVRIGAGLASTGRLSGDAMGRGLETLQVFARFCRANHIAPGDVHVVATSAIRDAANGQAFLDDAQRVSGLQIEVLDARAEAYFGYVAAVNSTTLDDGVVLDIGGGSMQLTAVRDRLNGPTVSFPLGAVRVTEELLPGTGPVKRKQLARVRARVEESLANVDWLGESGRRLVGIGGAVRVTEELLPGTGPVKRKQLARVRARVEESLANVDWLGESGRRLVGIGGAVRNLAAASQHAAGGLDLGVQGFVITAAMLAELVETLAALPVPERGSVPGIKPGRGDIILASAVVLQTVLDAGGFDGLEATEAGLREGVFLARTLLADSNPLIADVRGAAVRNLAIQYESDLRHVEHVALLSEQMFDSLVAGGLFLPRPGERELLWAASMLHDVGMTISYDDHHKHSRYLIEAAELPGFDPRERALIAQMTRYHRKGIPKLGALASVTRPDDEEVLDRCSVILRLAEHLERGRDQSVSVATLDTNGDGVDLHLKAGGDLLLPRWSVERYGDGEAFERVFHRRLLID